jgi:hypothetical protein
LVFLVLALYAPQVCVAQAVQDSVRNTTDSTKPVSKFPSAADIVKTVTKPKKFQPNPKKAGLYSAIIPGLGQAYNRNYWKVPVVLVGIGVAGYFYRENYNDYQDYRKAYISRIGVDNPAYWTDEFNTRYDKTQLLQYQNDAKKYLDMTVLFSGIGYALVVLDAVTSAHLKNFDISRDISMKVSPVVVPGGGGMALVVNLK